MSYRVDPHASVPPSRQIVQAVMDTLARGEVGPGERLPSVRSMAVEALVNPNTVSKAYRDLEHLGVIEGRNGSGVYVTDAGPKIARDERRAATMAAFAAAARDALRAGHKRDDLRRELSRQGSPKASGKGKRR